MQTIGKPVSAPARSYRSAIVSVGLHLAIFTVLVHQARHYIAPIRLPGAASGHNLVLSYLPGRAPKPAVAPPPMAKPLEVQSRVALHDPEKMTPTETSPNRNSPASDHPDSASGADALGSGNISIALGKYFPRPKPDLSGLPDGTRGDVIVDITIDETGKISDMKLVKGIEQKIDEDVLATVRQWTFNPANRDGQSIASEQELLFHYEKG